MSRAKDLNKIGVVNQTTMLAAETQAIADHLKDVMVRRYGKENLSEHFADTRDTLCYATYDNQQATAELVNQPADFALVVGGYNSSNTGHIVELCEARHKTFFISSADKLISREAISHYNLNTGSEEITHNYLPAGSPVSIILTSGASCPDAVVDQVLHRILSFFKDVKPVGEVLSDIRD